MIRRDPASPLFAPESARPSPSSAPSTAPDDSTPGDGRSVTPETVELEGMGSGFDFEAVPSWTVRAGRRTLREKLMAGLVGIKHAFRGDSSFFAHAYRALLVFLIAGMIGVPPVGWCMLVIGLGMVLMAELMHTAIDTLAKAVGDPEEPRLAMARDVAAACVLVAVVCSAAISITVLTLKLGDYLGWWERSV